MEKIIMAEEIMKTAKQDINSAEDELRIAAELIKKLKMAGENTTELEAQYRKSDARLKKFKRAFT